MEAPGGQQEFTMTGNKDEDFKNGLAASLAESIDWDKEPPAEEETEETPAASTPAGETPATTETPAETQPPAATEEVPKIPEFDEAAYLDKLTNGRAKSKEEVEKLLGKDVSRFPELEKLYEHFDKKGTFETFNTIRKVGDIAAMTPLEAIRKEIEITSPELTPREIDIILAKKYPSDADRDSEEDIETGQALLKLDGPAAKARLEQIVDDLKIPQAAKEEINVQEQLKKAANDWGEAVAAEAPNLSKIELTFPDNTVPFVFEIPKEDIAELTAMAKELYTSPKLANKLAYGPDGKFDMQRLLKATYLADPNNFQKVVNAYGANGKSRGIEEIKKTLKNETEPGAGGTAGDGVQTKWETNEEALVRHLTT